MSVSNCSWKESVFGVVLAVIISAMVSVGMTAPVGAEAPDRQELMRIINETRQAARQASNPLETYMVLASAFERAESDAARNAIGQIHAPMLVQLGRYRDAARVYPYGPGDGRGGERPACSGKCNWQVVPAVDAIAERARDIDVIMINEAHHVARTRWLTYQLLAPLRELGYTHLAIEALNAEDKALAERGFAVAESGHYIREPVFAELVREAMRLGYEVVAYESSAPHDSEASPEERQQRRETGQAENLAAVFEEDPDARMLVHAGYAHIFRNQKLNGARVMIDEFERITGLSTLAIDQTNTLAGDDPDKPGKHFDAVLDAIDPQGRDEAPSLTVPSVLRDADGSLWSLRPENFDISVLVPRGQKPGRGNEWLSLGGHRQAQVLDGEPCHQSFPCLIEARHADEPDAAVPTDRVLRREASDKPLLWLKPGCYRLRVFTQSGEETKEHCVDSMAGADQADS